MTCPECHSERNQRFHEGFPATATTPREPPSWECLECGHVYLHDTLAPGAADDVAYEKYREAEIQGDTEHA